MKTIRKLACLAMVSMAMAPIHAVEATKTVSVTPLAKSGESWDGKAISYPKGKAEITSLLIEIAPKGETSWHSHPVPSFAYILEGSLEITLRDGKVKRLQAGESLIEVVNTAHNGRNIGDGPVKLIVFYAGSADLPLTHKE